MSDPCGVCAAITGSLPTKAHNPAVPMTVSEQIESAQEAFEAGAFMVQAVNMHEDGLIWDRPYVQSVSAAYA